ncbi:FAD-dependent oxidoreductase [Actinoplanes sp. TRM 88003]|uniref:FAD-dependent oxidoreductase n=1 Tax=Paractinoplanes aksuensis TaxID=2939490 RepID=A0ABT1E3P4_9ACTN|nr:FAD-dependent oxidoreductase [Actinoplanes aksuensis]MCO8276876.1 FAD-dependent oxidoreductase [Actinoplanes aksuensis]
MKPTTEQIDIVVVGAGYAGVIATNRLLASLTEAEVRRVRLTVINPTDQFVERIRFHELAAGTRRSAFVPLTELLHQAAQLLVGRVEVIDPDARTVHVSRPGRTEIVMPWDHLIYAVGSTAATTIPGSREHGFLLGDLDGAESAAAAVRGAGPGARIVVIGGGFTGVEAAGEIAEQHPGASVVLMCAGTLVPAMRAAARRSLTRSLNKLGVQIQEQQPVARIEPGQVVLADGRIEKADVCIVAASFTVPDLARTSGLAVAADGRMRVDTGLRSLDTPGIVGAGDAIVMSGPAGEHLRMGCAIALPLGGKAAETVLAQIRGQEPEPVSIGFQAQCISLGRKRGYIQLVHADDRPRPLHIGGRLGARVKESVCKMSVSLPAKERTKPGAYPTPKGPTPKSGS